MNRWKANKREEKDTQAHMSGRLSASLGASQTEVNAASYSEV